MCHDLRFSSLIRKILVSAEHEVSHGILVFGDVATSDGGRVLCVKMAHLGVIIQILESHRLDQVCQARPKKCQI